MNFLDEYMSTEWEYILMENVSHPKGIIHFKTTEQIVGFLVNVVQTYTAMDLYLTEIYLTLNSWKYGKMNRG